MDITPHIGSESPPLRSTVLGFGASFLRGRPRAASHIDNNNNSTNPTSPNEFARELSPPQARSPGGGHRRRPGTGGNGGSNNNGGTGSSVAVPTSIQSSVSHNPSSAPSESTSTSHLGLHMLRRRRSGGVPTTSTNATVPTSPPPPMNRSAPTPAAQVSSLPQTTSTGASHRIRLVPHLDSRRTLRFEPITRNLKEGDAPLRIGRFTDRSGMGLAAANALSSTKLAFKSKVVSRAHAEIWVEAAAPGQTPKFFIKDTKSSSGTFLNHVRLSPANTESKPHQIKDGDILQLGVDYQGGTEDMYKSVKIRIEVGREWQSAANAFNTNALNQLKSLAVTLAVDSNQPVAPTLTKKQSRKTNIPDCCICLFAVTIRQALFIAPCSHAFHFKCIRPLLETHPSAFSCPLCRTFADLEEDVEVEPEIEDDDDAELAAALAAAGTPNAEAEGSASGSGSGEPNGVNLPPSISSRNQRDRSRERDGVETEVEAESGTGLGPSRSRMRGHRPSSSINPAADLGEHAEEDVEMLDVGSDADDADAAAARARSLSPDFGGHTARGAAGGSSGQGGADTSEGEGSGGSGSAEGGEGEMGLAHNGEHPGDLTIGGKRKR